MPVCRGLQPISTFVVACCWPHLASYGPNKSGLVSALQPQRRISMHQIWSQACGVAAPACVYSGYETRFLIDSENRKRKKAIVL